VFADPACALRALLAGGKSQRKSYRAKQDSEHKPQKSIFASIAGYDCGANAKQQPNYDEEHFTPMVLEGGAKSMPLNRTA
jgi:hypothetical protein